ncbi:unnamed protein product [Spirodela intermedia]|uniref:Uncharacterized protein n=1 Tax=Spirodela intermedia TaxID=51605 RepID=A0A7I8KIH1_SPIIN|nr:unnamed protein product [Spirodela intermedia]
MAETSSLMLIFSPLPGAEAAAAASSPVSTAFLLTIRDSFSANSRPSSVGMATRWRRSDLLPMSITTMLGSVWSLSSFSHRSTFSKVVLRVTSHPPPHIYLSWPAVSQIWALMTLPSTLRLRVANSTPMVDLDSRLNSFLVNLESRFDFPTPESPISTTLNK